jgi:hypothetical protein
VPGHADIGQAPIHAGGRQQVARSTVTPWAL